MALAQLPQAIYSHIQWQTATTRALLRRLSGDQMHFTAEPAQTCGFEAWCYCFAPQLASIFPALSDFEYEHAKVHTLAEQLQNEARHDTAPSQGDYAGFAGSLDAMQSRLFSLKLEVEETLFQRGLLVGGENRCDMLAQLGELHELVKRGRQQSSIAVTHLDHFQQINEVYGQVIGDRILQASMAYIRKHMRSIEKVFHHGRESFLIAMPNTNLDDARTALERIRKGLSATVLASANAEPISTTGSFGIAPLRGDWPVENSIHHTEQALEAAKHEGPNRVVVWAPASDR